jgi:hypothetical protein
MSPPHLRGVNVGSVEEVIIDSPNVTPSLEIPVDSRTKHEFESGSEPEEEIEEELQAIIIPQRERSEKLASFSFRCEWTLGSSFFAQ